MVALAIIAGSTEKHFSEILKWLWLAHSNNAISESSCTRVASPAP